MSLATEKVVMKSQQMDKIRYLNTTICHVFSEIGKLREFSGKNMRLKNNLLKNLCMSHVKANPIWFNFTSYKLFTIFILVVNLILIPFCSTSLFG